MSRLGEQLCPNGWHAHFKPGGRRWYKRITNRRWRRAAKLRLDDAPIKRRFAGYAD